MSHTNNNKKEELQQQLQYYPPQNYQQYYQLPQYFQPTLADIVMPTSYYYDYQPSVVTPNNQQKGKDIVKILATIGGIGLIVYFVYEKYKKEKEEERRMIYDLIRNYSSEIEKLKEFLSSMMPRQKKEDDEDG